MNSTPDMQRELDSLRQFIDAHSDIKVLLENSRTWADSQAEHSERSRRTAWRVAAGAGAFGALAMVVALTTVITSHRPAPPPEVLVADKSTGAVERLVSLRDFQETASEATIKRLITSFMRARESYSYDTAEQSYFDGAAFMSPALQGQWAQYWDISNPDSPLTRYKRDTSVRIDIGAITINRDSGGKPTSARVSFTRTIKRNDQVVSPPTHWIATIVFAFANVPQQERARRVNDVGFVVADYQVDADIAANGSTSAVAASARTPQPAAPLSPPQALQAPQATPGGQP